MAESFLKSIGASVLWRGLNYLAGLAKHIVIAAAIGLSAQLDVFYMAMALLGVLVFSWAGLLDIMAVPDMVRAWRENRHEEFRRIASGLFSLVLAGSAALALTLCFAWGEIANVAMGFDQGRKELLAQAIPWLLPAVLLYIPLRFIGSVLRAIRKFSLFYQAEFSIALVVLICVLSCEDAHVLLWSFSAGVSVAFLFLLFAARRHLFPLSSPFSPVVLRSLNMAPGLLLLQCAGYVFVLSDRIFVSFLPEGAVSALAYGATLVALLPNAVSLNGAFITVAAEHGSREKRAEYLNDLVSAAIYLGVGATVFMLTAGEGIVQTLFERGMFTAGDTQNVARAISAYAWMILPLFLIGSVEQIFQVERRIGPMVWRVVLGMLVNVALNAWFLFGLGWGLHGVALATAIAYWIMLLASLNALKRQGYILEKRRHLCWLGWNALFLAIVPAGFHVLPPFLRSGITGVCAAALLAGGAMLVAGLAWRGNEQKLLTAAIRRTRSGFRFAKD
ncbi:MAG: polysaccharide biosynthesis C-terminal domain-containing protein [Zoogloeaceae bacterium]|jgi:peptidoglycan biosynthesis protein MviN/MurJ (putative lipid II flippase)|nr:polysaccharide biosynthesis C-terminal domain-containing protein [Zoogloeaceae bacterium]